MSLVTINSLGGTPPYQVSVCDIFQFSCVTATTIYDYIPPSVSFNLQSSCVPTNDEYPSFNIFKKLNVVDGE